MKASFLAACALIGFTTVLRGQGTTSTVPDTGYVEYKDSPISLPLGVGLRVPSYDRVNGLALPWGPKLDLGEEKLQLDALVTYRSNLGKWDPSLEGFARPGAANEIRVYVGRGTFTNDSWIRSDVVNSLAALGVGSDARNYFRGDRATTRFTRTISTAAVTLTPFIGGVVERDWSTGSIAPPKSPWSFFGRKGVLQMRRPNPPVADARINSILGGSGIQLSRGGVEATLDLAIERTLSTKPPAGCAFADASCLMPDSSFTQATIDSRVTFPTFGSQSFAFRGHALWTSVNLFAPPQRWGYLGGSGTLATVNLLALGGDRLLYLEGEYMIPFDRIQFPIVGSPYVALRYATGSAGLMTLPALIQNVGVGAGVSFFRVDFSVDPARNRSPLSRKSAFSFGLEVPM